MTRIKRASRLKAGIIAGKSHVDTRRHSESFDGHLIGPRREEFEGEESLSVVDLLLHLVYDLHGAARRSKKEVNR